MIGDNRFRPFRDDFSTGILEQKFSIGRPGVYVLDSATTIDGQAKFAVTLSNNFVNVYDVHGHLLDDYAHEQKVTAIKYSESQPACLFTSSLDGKITIFDSRCQGAVQTFVDDSDDYSKPLLCFDLGKDENTLCAGTETIREDSFILFWDRRTSEVLGGYWNSHTNDITQVEFDSGNCTYLASASLDGLINIFDLTKSSEEEALEYTLNTECAVNMLRWRDGDYLSCITCLDEYQIWTSDGAAPVVQVTKKTMPEPEMKVYVDYMIDTVKIHNSYYLATGTNEGTVSLWNSDKNRVEPYGYTLRGHYDTVRTISYNFLQEYIVTGGEDGCVCIWKLAQ